MIIKFSTFCRKHRIQAQVHRWKRLFKFTKVEGYIRPWIEESRQNLTIVKQIHEEANKLFHPSKVNLIPMSAFCRKVGLPYHRLCRWQHRFETMPVGKFKKPWMIINEHNNKLAAELLVSYGTRPKKARLSFTEYRDKYGIEMTRLSDVYNRLDLEESNGHMLIADTKKNYALLTTGRPFLK